MYVELWNCSGSSEMAGSLQVLSSENVNQRVQGGTCRTRGRTKIRNHLGQVATVNNPPLYRYAINKQRHHIALIVPHPSVLCLSHQVPHPASPCPHARYDAYTRFLFVLCWKCVHNLDTEWPVRIELGGRVICLSGHSRLLQS